MDFPIQIITKNAQETQDLGERLATHLIDETRNSKLETRANIICLYGELGSGKTTFVQGSARALGIDKRIASPTYTIVRRHGIPDTDYFLYHLDLYRLSDEDELKSIGFEQMCTELGSIVIIEWAEKLHEYVPKDRIDVRYSVVEKDQRKIIITKNQDEQ